MSEENNSPIQYKVPFYIAAKSYITRPTSKGRSSRSEFWWGLLFSTILDMGVEGIFGDSFVSNISSLVFCLFDIFLWWRRMQDIGKSGWWSLVPLYDFYLATKPSEMCENKYGPVPNTQPIAEDKRLKKIIAGVMIVFGIMAVVCLCRDDDSAEAAFERYAESLCENDAKKFFSSVYLEDVSTAKIEANKDMLDMLFKKFQSEILDDKMRKFMNNPTILDVVEDEDGAYVKFTTKDKGLLAQMKSEGFSGMMIKVVETEDGWRVCIDSMRPIFGSQD